VKIAPLLLIICFFGCNKPFDPKDPVETKLVVYSVISTDSDIQYVRVYSNYDVSGFNPFENGTDSPITGAQVIISGRTGSYTLRDTLLVRPDRSRYKSPISAYVGRFRPLPGEAYTLTVNATGIGPTSATVTTPQQSQTINWSGSAILDDPDNQPMLFFVGCSTQLARETKAYTFQMAIEYAVPASGGWRTQSIEVPTYASDSSFNYASYPTLYASYIYAGGSYSKSAYIATLYRVVALNRSTNLTFKRIVFRFLQVDQNWYDYYNIVRQFQDPHSIRLDQPDFTNLSNGYGLFGACTVDSIVHEYPADFKYNH
jgi:hypothetical protein